MTDRLRAPTHVVIAGGGPAALEGALKLQLLAGDRVRITLLAPDPTFPYRPLSVAEPFGLAPAVRFSLPRLAAERGIAYVRDALAGVDVAARRLHTAGGETIAFDALLITVGARAQAALPGALTFRGSEDARALRASLEALGTGISRVAFVAAPTTAWTLPLYELAVMTAHWASEQELGLETWLVTHENRALGMFGDEVAVRVADLLEDAAVRLWTGAFADCVEDGRLWLDMEGGLPVDLAVALPRPAGRHIPGLPADDGGFLPVDAHGLVDGSPGVYAAGDITTRPLRQGGLAAQQADVAATAIALQAGAPVELDDYRPTLRGMLLTGRRPVYLSRTPGRPGEASLDAPWWPPHKIAGRHLGPYLAAHSELREAEPVST
jgi:sulfide:quinone oxidoreductase